MLRPSVDASAIVVTGIVVAVSTALVPKLLTHTVVPALNFSLGFAVASAAVRSLKAGFVWLFLPSLEPQILTSTRSTILDLFAVDTSSPVSGILSTSDLFFTAEVGPADVESMDMTGYDGADEENTVDYHVCFGTTEEHDAQRRKNDVDAHDSEAFEHLGGFERLSQFRSSKATVGLGDCALPTVVQGFL